jgi:hypothetical protein
MSRIHRQGLEPDSCQRKTRYGHAQGSLQRYDITAVIYELDDQMIAVIDSDIG